MNRLKSPYASINSLIDSNVKVVMGDMMYIGPFQEDITIIDLKTTFQMLRCFGEMMTELNFDGIVFYPTVRNNKHVLQYIHEFCGESLKKLTLDGLSGIEIFDVHEKSFPNLEYLKFSNSTDLNRQCLSRIFLKLRCLDVTVIRPNTFSILSEHFPNLDYLSLGGDEYFADHKENLINVLRLNPQLHTFKSIYDSSRIHEISEHLQSIECLGLRVWTTDTYQNAINFQNVKHFKVQYVYGTNSELDFIRPMPF